MLVKLFEEAGLPKGALNLVVGNGSEIGDVKAAATGLVLGAFAFSGQVSISAQRIYVQKGVYEEFLNQYVSTVKDLVIGNPAEESTDIGLMISEKEAIRAHNWIQEAVQAGAKLAISGSRNGTLLEQTILVDV